MVSVSANFYHAPLDQAPGHQTSTWDLQLRPEVLRGRILLCLLGISGHWFSQRNILERFGTLFGRVPLAGGYPVFWLSEFYKASVLVPETLCCCLGGSRVEPGKQEKFKLKEEESLRLSFTNFPGGAVHCNMSQWMNINLRTPLRPYAHRLDANGYRPAVQY